MAKDRQSLTDQMAILNDGVSISFLATFFNMDKRHVALKLPGVKVVGEANGHPRYDFKEAMQKLARPSPEQVMEYVKKMRPNDLPPMMQSEFWNAQLRRQKFERDANNTWHTEDVLSAFAEVFKAVRTAAQLMADATERETGLTPAQRTIITSLGDAMLADVRTKLIDNPKFTEWRTQRARMTEDMGDLMTVDIDGESSFADDDEEDYFEG